MKNTIMLCSLLLTAVGCVAMDGVLEEAKDAPGSGKESVRDEDTAVMVLGQEAPRTQDMGEEYEPGRPQENVLESLGLGQMDAERPKDAVEWAKELFMTIIYPALGDVRECFDMLHKAYIRTNHFLVSEDDRLRYPDDYARFTEVDKHRRFLLKNWVEYLLREPNYDEGNHPQDPVVWAQLLIDTPESMCREAVLACVGALADEFCTKRDSLNDQVDPAIQERMNEIGTICERLQQAWRGHMAGLKESAEVCIVKLGLVISAETTPITETYNQERARQREVAKWMAFINQKQACKRDLSERLVFWNECIRHDKKCIDPIDRQLKQPDYLAPPLSKRNSGRSHSGSSKSESQGRSSQDRSSQGESAGGARVTYSSSSGISSEDGEPSRSDVIRRQKEALFMQAQDIAIANSKLEQENAEQELQNHEALHAMKQSSARRKNNLVTVLKATVRHLPCRTRDDLQLTARDNLVRLRDILGIAQQHPGIIISFLENELAMREEIQKEIVAYVVVLNNERAALKKELEDFRAQKTENENRQVSLRGLIERIGETLEETDKALVEVLKRFQAQNNGGYSCVVC